MSRSSFVRLAALIGLLATATNCGESTTEPPVVQNIDVALETPTATVVGTRGTSGTSGVLFCEFDWTATASGTGTFTWKSVKWTIASPAGTPNSEIDPVADFGLDTDDQTAGSSSLSGGWQWSSTESNQPRYRAFTVTLSMTYTQAGSDEEEETAPITMACNPPEPEPTVLANGTPVTGIDLPAGYSALYTLDVPAGMVQLDVTTLGGTGDLDLYVRRGEAPTLTTSDCKSETGTADESCTIADPAAGTWYILAYAWAPFNDVTLTATASSTPPEPEEPGFTIAGPVSRNLLVGGNATVTITATRTGGFDEPIALAVEGLPAGVTASPATIDAGSTSATITLTAADGTTPGTTTITVRATATAMDDQTISFPLTVSTGATGGEPIELLHAFQYAPGSMFNTPDGRNPEGGLVQGSDGNFYGTTSGGGMPTSGMSGKGTVFRITPAGQLTTLVTFEHITVNGELPHAALTPGADGSLYGLANDGTFFKISMAGTYTRIARNTEVQGTLGRLIVGPDGAFYGTTAHGGPDNDGSVFKITAGGAVTTLATFNGANGSIPFAALVLGPDGNFYGTTSSGGSGTFGTVFRMTPAGSLTTLVNFTGGGAGKNGSTPRSQLAVGPDGNLWGTTHYGGQYGGGTIFKVSTSGAFTTVHTFNPVTPELGCNCGLGDPRAGLLLASDGNFYGTTGYGQPESGAGPRGAVYRITPAGEFSVVAWFWNHAGSGEGGEGTFDTLVQGTDGRLYGTTYSSGVPKLGIVYRVNVPGL